MSKERKFHEWIEQQNREEKDRVWAKIQQKEEERLSVTQQETEDEQPAIPKRTAFSWRKWAAVAATSLAVIFLGAFAVAKFLPFDDSVVNNSSCDDSSGRYFDAQSYETVETQTNLKGYAQEIGENLLYFDWYEETDYLKNNAWKLTDTQEIICFQEEIIDVNTGCIVTIFVVEANTRIEAFSPDENTDRNFVVNEVSISWRLYNDRAIANFEYEDYRYYLRIKEPLNEEYVFALLEELLP